MSHHDAGRLELSSELYSCNTVILTQECHMVYHRHGYNTSLSFLFHTHGVNLSLIHVIVLTVTNGL